MSRHWPWEIKHTEQELHEIGVLGEPHPILKRITGHLPTRIKPQNLHASFSITSLLLSALSPPQRQQHTSTIASLTLSGVLCSCAYLFRQL